jgi:hypothetical protein
MRANLANLANLANVGGRDASLTMMCRRKGCGVAIRFG